MTLTNLFLLYTGRMKRSHSVPPLKGILKTNHLKPAASEVNKWPFSTYSHQQYQQPQPLIQQPQCCCCVGLNERDHTVMHPDDPERNYVSHCHTENRDG